MSSISIGMRALSPMLAAVLIAGCSSSAFEARNIEFLLPTAVVRAPPSTPSQSCLVVQVDPLELARDPDFGHFALFNRLALWSRETWVGVSRVVPSLSSDVLWLPERGPDRVAAFGARGSVSEWIRTGGRRLSEGGPAVVPLDVSGCRVLPSSSFDRATLELAPPVWDDRGELAAQDVWHDERPVEEVALDVEVRASADGRSSLSSLRCGTLREEVEYFPLGNGEPPSVGRAIRATIPPPSRLGWDGRPNGRVSLYLGLVLEGPVRSVRVDGRQVAARDVRLARADTSGWTRVELELAPLSATPFGDGYVLELAFAEQGPWGCPFVARVPFIGMGEVVAGQPACVPVEWTAQPVGGDIYASFRAHSPFSTAPDRSRLGFFGYFPEDLDPDWQRPVNFPSTFCIQSPWWRSGGPHQLWLGGAGETLLLFSHRSDPLFEWYVALIGLLGTFSIAWSRRGPRVTRVLWSRKGAPAFREVPEGSWTPIGLEELERRTGPSTDGTSVKVTVVGWGPFRMCRAEDPVRVWRPGRGWRMSRLFRVAPGTCVLTDSDLLVFTDEESVGTYTVAAVRALFQTPSRGWRPPWPPPLFWRILLGAGLMLGVFYVTFVAAEQSFYFATRQGFILFSSCLSLMGIVVGRRALSLMANARRAR